MNRMKCTIVVAMFALSALPALAVDLENIKLRDPTGVERKNNKVPQKDNIVVTYDIKGLKIDAVTKNFNFETTIELLDSKGMGLFKETELKQPAPNANGIPETFNIMVRGLGKYEVKVTVKDRVTKDGKAFFYPIEITK